MPKLNGYRRPLPGTQPEVRYPAYVSSRRRSPLLAPIAIPQTLTEITGPVFSPEIITAHACDLTRQTPQPPQGERIVVSGRVIDENARPVAGTLVEIWQANAAGRYRHDRDRHDAPLDPNFLGAGQTLTDAEGRFRFITIRPGAYPWKNHHNAWRPRHIHFSVFGPAFATRLVTQMYFPNDPLFAFDPIFQSTADEQARLRLISSFDWETTVPEWALGYRFDLVLAGREATPWES